MMADGPENAAPKQGAGDSDRLASLASRVLTVVASRVSGERREADDEVVTRLRDMVLHGESHAREDFIREMDDAGVSREELADIYVPEAARRLGDEWCDDELSFTDVTIGSARLQRLLRVLGPEWRSDLNADANAPSVLVAVAASNNHTLGAMLVTGQLRRLGFSVRLSLGETTADFARRMNSSRFDMLLISASGSEKLVTVRNMVKIISQAEIDQGPVVLGGPILQFKPEANSLEYVDHFTSDPAEAIRLCGLTTRPTDAGSHASGR